MKGNAILKLFYKIIVRLLSLSVNRIIKKQNIVVFSSGIHNGDAIESVYSKRNLINGHVYCFTRNKNDSNNRIIYCYSLTALKLILLAKVFVIDVNVSDILEGFIPAKSQIVINLRHGVPLKHMGYDIKDKNKLEIDKQVSRAFSGENIYVLVGGIYEEKIFATSCKVYKDNFLRLGRTSIDVLHKLKKEGNEHISEFKREHNKYDKIIFYCPTFREGEKFKLFPFSDSNIKDFDDFLKKRNMILYLKLHPLHQDDISSLSYSNIQLYNGDLTVNEILTVTDVLITDYSSIFFDYLPLHKKMVFIPYDLVEYENKRGLYTDNYFEFVPGDIVNSFEGLRKSLQNDQIEIEKILHFEKIINGYDAGNTDARIAQTINSFLNS